MGGIGRVAVPVGIAALSGAAAVGHLVINGSFPTMFLLHIVGMTLAFVAIGPIAALVKKAPGNTMLHFFVAATTSFTAMGAYYAIYQHKNNIGKPHVLTASWNPFENLSQASWHALVGAGAMITWLFGGLAGAVFLHPVWGIDQNDKNKRLVHKWHGRIAIGATLFACSLGWQKLFGDSYITYAFWAACVAIFLLVVFFRVSKFK